MTATATDLFCGAGGMTEGAAAAGVEVVMAANHWPLAIDVHQVNHPGTGHDCADISQVDPRRYPKTDILLAGPECTNHTSAKGVSRKKQDPSLWDAPDPAAERSRATMWDVHRFVEHHRYAAVFVENVVEAASWTYIRSWLQAWDDAGYEVRPLSINSAHTGLVPQWRDRLYWLALRRGIAFPDLELRPPCWCPRCERVVEGVQSWRGVRKIGRWRRQYDYRCGACNTVAVPPAPPVEPVIDWSIAGERIGDRARPLAPKTMARIEHGIAEHGLCLVAAAGNTYERPGSTYKRAWPVTEPAQTQTVTRQHALVVPHRQNGRARRVDEPTPTVTAGGFHLGLLRAPQSGGQLAPTTRPSPTVATKAAPMLLTYRRGGQLRPADEPSTTTTTVEGHAVVGALPRAEDCTYRMLGPHESKRIQGFREEYHLAGTLTEQQALVGNAVSPPVPQDYVARILEAIG